MRPADYVGHAWRGAVRQPVRTGLTVVSLAISATIVISLVSISLGAQRIITTERGLTQGLTTMVVTPNSAVTTGVLGAAVQVVNSNAEKITDPDVKRIRQVAGVTDAVPLAAIPELRQFTISGSSTPFVAGAAALGPRTSYRLPLAAGRAPEQGKAGFGEVVLGSAFADALQVSDRPQDLIGRKLTITTQNGYRGVGAKVPGLDSTAEQREAFAQRPTKVTATIVGVSDDSRFANRLITSMGWAHAIRTPKIVERGRLVDGPSAITDHGYASVVVDAAALEDVAPVSTRIEALGFGVSSTQEQIERINRYILIMWLVLGSITLVSLLVAALGIANTMLMTISQERYTINIWRVCGARRATIRRLYLLQAGLMSLLGGSLGMVSGYWLTWFLSAQIQGVLQGRRGIATVAVAESSPQILLLGLLVTLVVGVVAALYPAGRAARLEPGALLSAH